MDNLSELTFEQQCHLRIFQHQVNQMSREQAQTFLVYLYRQSMLRDNSYRELFGQDWKTAKPNPHEDDPYGA